MVKCTFSHQHVRIACIEKEGERREEERKIHATTFLGIQFNIKRNEKKVVWVQDYNCKILIITKWSCNLSACTASHARECSVWCNLFDAFF